jgi:hypothetical protein
MNTVGKKLRVEGSSVNRCICSLLAAEMIAHTIHHSHLISKHKHKMAVKFGMDIVKKIQDQQS